MQIALTVVANPYLALDHKGRPACAVNYPNSTQIVGGLIDHEAIKESVAESVSGEGKIVFAFSEVPVQLICGSIPEFAYFRNRILEGALIPADEATARKCGIVIDEKHPFVPASEALQSAKTEAAAAFKKATGLEAPFLAPKVAPSASSESQETKKTSTKAAASPAEKG